MNQLKNLIGVEKIESMFAEDIECFYARQGVGKKRPKRKLRIDHLYWIPSLIYNQTYGVLPRILKDIFFCLSIIHKSPSSKILARTRYDELRTLIDIKISALALKRVPANILDDVKETFSSGSYTTNLLYLSELDTLINDVTNSSLFTSLSFEFILFHTSLKIPFSLSLYLLCLNLCNESISLIAFSFSVEL